MQTTLLRRVGGLLFIVLLLAGCEEITYEVSPSRLAEGGWDVPSGASGEVAFVGGDEAPDPPSGIGSARLRADHSERAELRHDRLDGLPLGQEFAELSLGYFVPEGDAGRLRVELHLTFDEVTDTDVLTFNLDPGTQRGRWIDQPLAKMKLEGTKVVVDKSLLWQSQRCEAPVVLGDAYCADLPGTPRIAQGGLRIILEGGEGAGSTAYVDRLDWTAGPDYPTAVHDFEPAASTQRVTDLTFERQQWKPIASGFEFVAAADAPAGPGALSLNLRPRADAPEGPITAIATAATYVPGVEGMPLTDLAVLRYWSRTSSTNPCFGPNLQLDVQVGDTVYPFFYEPCWQTNQNNVRYAPKVAADTWQHWLADTGLWWSTTSNFPVYGLGGVTAMAKKHLPAGSTDVLTIKSLRLGVGGRTIPSMDRSQLPKILIDGLTIGRAGDASSTAHDFTVAEVLTADEATPASPRQLAVSSPFGGPVTVNLAKTSTPNPDGFELLDQEFDVTAPPAEPAQPLRLEFTVHASALTTDRAGNYLVPIPFRNGVEVPGCVDGAVGAAPDPCVSSLVMPTDGNPVMTMTILTSRASVWSMGYRKQASFNFEPAPPPPPPPAVPQPRFACPPDAVPPAGFVDVGSDNAHAASINCVAWWKLAQGQSGSQFAPSLPVTRGQMATFVAGALRAAGVDLDAGEPLQAEDGVHAANAAALLHAGIVSGRSDGTFGLAQPVTRAQIATFLVAAYEHALGVQLATGEPHFSDIAQSVHRTNIEKAAEAGMVVGVVDDIYEPDTDVRREQMASFLVRLLNAFVAVERATPPAR